MNKKILTGVFSALLAVFVFSGTAAAQGECTFNDTGSAWLLNDDCTTNTTIYVPDGYLLDGQKHTITAVDPANDQFRGPIVTNAGSYMDVENLGIATDSLSNVCHLGDDTLTGIQLSDASGTIRNNIIKSVNKVNSSCDEGLGIVATKPLFSNKTNLTVEIIGNIVLNWQEIGIYCAGDNLSCNIVNNTVGESASNKLFINPVGIYSTAGATGNIEHNRVSGGTLCGDLFVGVGIVAYDAKPGLPIVGNTIKGDSDVGIYSIYSDAIITNNRLDDGANAEDCGPVDVGIWSEGNDVVSNNKIKNYNVSTIGVNTTSIIKALNIPLRPLLY